MTGTCWYDGKIIFDKIGSPKKSRHWDGWNSNHPTSIIKSLVRLEAESPTGPAGFCPSFFMGLFWTTKFLKEEIRESFFRLSWWRWVMSKSKSSVAQVPRHGLLLINFTHAEQLGKDSKIHQFLLKTGDYPTHFSPLCRGHLKKKEQLAVISA